MFYYNFLHFSRICCLLGVLKELLFFSAKSINIHQFYQKYRKTIAKCKIIKEKYYYLKNNS